MDKQKLLKQQRLRARMRPSLVLLEQGDMIIQDRAVLFLRKFMRIFIIQFYFNGCRRFEFTKKIDNSFEFKAYALNKWADINAIDNDGWSEAFGVYYKEKDWSSDCGMFLDVTLEDVMRDVNSVGFDYLPIAQLISKYFDVTIIKDNYKQITAHFEDGYFINCNEENIDPNNNQTIIHFKFEEEIFTENFPSESSDVPSEDFYKIAQNLAMFFDGADITAFDEIEKRTIKKSYKYDYLSDYAAKQFNYDNPWHFEFEACTDETEKVQSNALIKVAMTPCKTKGKIEMYCDYRRIEYGMPLKAIEKALSETNRNFNVLIIIFQKNTMWTNAMKMGVENQYIYDSVYNHLKEEINKFLLWEKVLDYIKERISFSAFELWIKSIKFHGISDGKAVLSFKSDITKRMVFELYATLLQDAFLFVIDGN